MKATGQTRTSDGCTKLVNIYFTDGQSIRDKQVEDVHAEGHMLVVKLSQIESVERTAVRSVSVTATKSLIYPMNRILRCEITETCIATETNK